MAEKRSVAAREVLADIRVGMTDEQLMTKYTLSDKGIQSLKNKLLAAGFLPETELVRSSTSTQTSVPRDTKVLARQIAEAVRTGWPDEEIARTFGLLAEKLPNVFPLLIKHGYLSREDYDRRQSRLEEAIDIKLDLGPATENLDPKIDATPFAIIRGRTLLASLVLAAIATLVASGIIWGVWGIKMESPLGGAISGVLFYVFLLLCAAYLLHLAKLSPVMLFGSHPPWSLVKRSMLLVFPLITFSIAGVFFLYLPLSYLAPGFVQWQLFSHTPEIIVCTTDYTYIPVNLLNLFTIGLIAPVVEEFLTRGLLLTRWSFKWNVPLGILGSSIVFCLLHCDIIGSFFFSFVLSVLYIQTRSLFIPITIHAANNAIVWVLAGVDMLAGEPSSLKTVAQFQSFWWVGLVAGVIAIPWVIWFTKRHFPKADWRIPYIALQEGT